MTKRKAAGICFVITGNPATKKNSQQIFYNKKTGKRFVSQSEKYKSYESNVINQLSCHNENIDSSVTVNAVFYRDSHHRVDLTNLLEALDDALVKAGVLVDDNYNIIVLHDGSRVKYDKENPRT